MPKTALGSKDRTGKVYLIGAGPGDPGLITVKGVECLRGADVVVYDYLANPRLLSYAGDNAEKIYVGKRGDDHTAEQEQINSLLVQEAQKGRTVARLKGGDAFIFGRGGEEALSLAEHDIEFEVVPGVSSAYAVPAYAGIPVTHRGLASDVSFITGHEQRGAAGPGIAWEMLAKSGGTLVFLMGVKNLATIREELLRHGKAKDTPVAVIRWGTTADQETLTSTLEKIADDVEEAGFRPPAVLVVGEVVRLRERLAWFEKRPLFGRRVVVTRAAGQSGGLGELLAAEGAEVIEFPTITILPVDDYSSFDAAVGGRAETRPSKTRAGGAPDNPAAATGDHTRGEPYDWIVFTSANAVKYTVERLRDLELDVRAFAGAKIAAVGTATAAALSERGLRADLVPADFHAEGLLEEFGRMGVAGKRILIPRAREAWEILPKALREMDADVTVAPVYRNEPAMVPPEGLLKEISENRIDCVTFTSGSTLKNFIRSVGDDACAPLRADASSGRALVAVIGPVTAATAHKAGLRVDIMPETSTIPALAAAVKNELSQRR